MKTTEYEKHLIVLIILNFILMLSACPTLSENSVGKMQEPPDSTMKLLGGSEGTLFESLRIEGEDLIRIEFERPELILNLDPKSTQGLDWRSVDAVLDRLGVSLLAPYMKHSTGQRRQCFARPWLDEFASDGVARFRPNVESVDRWRLMVASSNGETVANFEGKGKPPKEIVWDGRSLDGKPVAPGLAYSYVLEAYDRAGNKRNFLGEGFELPSYRIDTPEGRIMLFSGSQVLGSQGSGYGGMALPPPVILDVANYINMETDMDAPVHIEVTARSFEEANRLAEDILLMLKPYLLGNLLRVKPVSKVQSDAPDRGTVVVLLPRS